MTKKKSKLHRYMERNHLNLLTLVVAIVFGVLTLVYTRTVVVINQTYTPPAGQATWHDVETWQFTLVAVPATSQTGVPQMTTPQATPTYDLAGFLGNISWCVTLGVAGLIGLYKLQKEGSGQAYNLFALPSFGSLTLTFPSLNSRSISRLNSPQPPNARKANANVLKC